MTCRSAPSGRLHASGSHKDQGPWCCPNSTPRARPPSTRPWCTNQPTFGSLRPPRAELCPRYSAITTSGVERTAWTLSGSAANWPVTVGAAAAAPGGSPADPANGLPDATTFQPHRPVPTYKSAVQFSLCPDNWPQGVWSGRVKLHGRERQSDRRTCQVSRACPQVGRSTLGCTGTA